MYCACQPQVSLLLLWRAWAVNCQNREDGVQHDMLPHGCHSTYALRSMLIIRIIMFADASGSHHEHVSGPCNNPVGVNPAHWLNGAYHCQLQHDAAHAQTSLKSEAGPHRTPAVLKPASN